MKWNGKPEIIAAIEAESAQISQEVLALEIIRENALEITDEELGLALQLTKVN